MAWSKTKQQLESFLAPALRGCVAYRATGYRYATDKTGRCYITVDKVEVLKMNEADSPIHWYQSEQDVKNDPNSKLPIALEDIEKVRRDSSGKIPEERLAIIASSRKTADVAKAFMTAQDVLSRSDFHKVANDFLSTSLEKSLESDAILMNILALLDRRLGKKRLVGLKETISYKHPAVGYFYELRIRC